MKIIIVDLDCAAISRRAGKGITMLKKSREVYEKYENDIAWQ